MTAGQGIGSFLGVGLETVYGTEVARTKFVAIKREGLKLQQAIKTRDCLQAQASPVGWWPGGKKVVGPTEHNLLFEGYEGLLKHLFGSASSVQQGATSAYKHTFTLNNNKPVGLSVELCKDVKSSVFHGGKIPGGRFAGTEFDCVQLGLDWLCEDETTPMPTKSTPTFPADLPIIPKGTATVLKLGGASVSVKNWGLNINDPLTDDRYAIGSSRVFKEPVRSGFRGVPGFMEMEFENDTEYAKYVAGTESSFEVSYVADQIAATGYYYTFNLKGTRIVFTGDTPPVEGPGVIPLKLNFIALYDVGGSKDAVILELTNTTVSVPL